MTNCVISLIINLINVCVNLKLKIMAFRFRRNRLRPVVPHPVNDVVQVSNVDENGVELVTFVSRPNSEVAKTLPSCADYKLEELLKANVPLQPVAANVLDAVPSSEKIEDIVTNIEKLDNSNESVEPSNN